MSSDMKLDIYRVLNLDQFLPKSSNRFADSNITDRLHLGILFQIYGFLGCKNYFFIMLPKR
jgi:hypothetical protein